MADKTVNTVTRTVTISDLTPEEMASIFAAWDDHQQGAFFNALHVEAKDWPLGGWNGQFWHVVKHLDANGREVVGDLVENYSARDE